MTILSVSVPWGQSCWMDRSTCVEAMTATPPSTLWRPTHLRRTSKADLSHPHPTPPHLSFLSAEITHRNHYTRPTFPTTRPLCLPGFQTHPLPPHPSHHLLFSFALLCWRKGLKLKDSHNPSQPQRHAVAPSLTLLRDRKRLDSTCME